MKLQVLAQYLLPQQLLSRLVGKLANCRIVFWKDFLIKLAIKHYKISLAEAVIENPEEYRSFNDFFTRELKSDARPLAVEEHSILAPNDGFVSQIGKIDNENLIQAKGKEFTLQQLLTDLLQFSQTEFMHGSFATLYLSPADYHRVHMPISGQLKKMVYVPGKLFSVNPQTANAVDGLYAKNERVILTFATAIGEVAVILVGAMLVASIATVWHGIVTPTKKREITVWDYSSEAKQFNAGDEIARFLFGSTVILLFPKDRVTWSSELKSGARILVGRRLGKCGLVVSE